MHFKYELVPEWPPLAWLAKGRHSDNLITVRHGRQVETRQDWFCEAVWAGDYAAGDFDRTDIVAGSGCRIRQAEAIFVSSGSTVDRLASIEIAGTSFVSNSLPCLLAAVDGRVDPSYPDYYENFCSIIHGLDKYHPFLDSSAGAIRLTYFNNLAWRGKNLEIRPKPFERRDFSSFDRYRGFLAGSLAAVAKNMAAPDRAFRYGMLSTLSTGYDSPTVTVLAKEAGCSEALCIDKARGGADEMGETIASQLGVSPLLIKRDGWRMHVLPEPPFIAGEGMGTDIPFKSAESSLHGRVLLTGYHGDKVWAKDTKHLEDTIVRGDPSGLSLTEYRLWAGFIHCPIPFWGVRQIGDLHALSNAHEMQPWNVTGNYSRPICRRIVEQAGVSRELFGQEKLASSVAFKELLAPDSMRHYLDWLKRQRWAWLKTGRLPPLASDKFEHWYYYSKNKPVRKVRYALSRTPVLWRLTFHDPYPELDTPTYLRRHLFPWALGVIQKQYKT